MELAPAPPQLPSACRLLVEALSQAEVQLLFSSCTNPGQKKLMQTSLGSGYC